MLNKQENINTETLNLLPIAVILFNNEKILFLNKKAASLFCIPKTQLKNIESFSIYSFLDKTYHKSFLNKTKLILKGEEFQEIELPFLNYKKQTVFLEAN